ncbi:hypothetical protein [Streptomyces sp. NPDC101132]|uniref:hypothetical protein n=1 Tax=Streptomyces sp. NPDC101132 TaxID=3366110 RepID=UPI003823607B
MLAAGACAVLAAGCGIQGTDVIEAGAPAGIGVADARGTWPLLYLLGPHGELTPVIRSNPFGMETGTAEYKLGPDPLVRLLMAGPTDGEKGAGLTTGLPVVKRLEGLRIDQDGTGAGAAGSESEPESTAIRLTLGIPVRPLSAAARQQLVCTLATDLAQGREATVTLTGTDGTLEAETCRVRRSSY